MLAQTIPFLNLYGGSSSVVFLSFLSIVGLGLRALCLNSIPMLSFSFVFLLKPGVKLMNRVGLKGRPYQGLRGLSSPNG